MSLGYYSLVQFCPDLGRLEAANIGLLLYCPEPKQFRVRMSRHLKRVRDFFGQRVISTRHFERIRAGIETRFKAAAKRFESLDDFQRFVACEANDILLTAPRPVAVEVLGRTMDELFETLVEKKRDARRPSSVRERLDAEFSKPEFEKLIAWDVAVPLSSLGSSITIPYGYQNGKFNLIQPAVFPDDTPADLLSRAGRFKLEGQLIHETNQELVVIGEFPNVEPGRIQRVRHLIGEQALFYTADELDQLLEDILRNAKPLKVE